MKRVSDTHSSLPMFFLFAIVLVISFFVARQTRIDNEKVTIAYLKNNPVTHKQKSIVAEKGRHYGEEQQLYTIDVDFPYIDSAEDSVNQMLATTYQGKIDDFKKSSLDSYISNQDEDNKVEEKSSLVIVAKEIFSTDRYSQLIVDTKVYSLKSAKTSHQSESYIYDKQKRSLVDLKDLFKQNSNYLSLLSFLSRKDLLKEKNVDKEAIIKRTAPTGTNFAKFALGEEGLAVYFEEDQIAPYKDVSRHIVIPYGEMKSIIDKDGILGDYIE